MKRDKPKKAKGLFRECAELIAETSVFVFFIMTFVAQTAQIPTSSMENTMLVGDLLFINKLAYARPVFPAERLFLPGRPVRRNDFVVFKSPVSWRLRLDFPVDDFNADRAGPAL